MIIRITILMNLMHITLLVWKVWDDNHGMVMQNGTFGAAEARKKRARGTPEEQQ